MEVKVNPISGWSRQETLKYLGEVLISVKTEREKMDTLAKWGEEKFIPRPKGLLVKFCPDCRNKLEKTNINSSPVWNYVIYSCSQCEYKFVKRQLRVEEF